MGSACSVGAWPLIVRRLCHLIRQTSPMQQQTEHPTSSATMPRTIFQMLLLSSCLSGGLIYFCAVCGGRAGGGCGSRADFGTGAGCRAGAGAGARASAACAASPADLASCTKLASSLSRTFQCWALSVGIPKQRKVQH
jgi:hypothetical protein